MFLRNTKVSIPASFKLHISKRLLPAVKCITRMKIVRLCMTDKREEVNCNQEKNRAEHSGFLYEPILAETSTL